MERTIESYESEIRAIDDILDMEPAYLDWLHGPNAKVKERWLAMPEWIRALEQRRRVLHVEWEYLIDNQEARIHA